MYSAANSISHISIRINCNRISEGRLYIICTFLGNSWEASELNGTKLPEFNHELNSGDDKVAYNLLSFSMFLDQPLSVSV
jgi:hypothetical protein